MTSQEYLEIALTALQATDPLLEIAPKDRHLLEQPAINVKDEIAIRIGSRPVARDLIALYSAKNESIPPDLETVRRGYRIWFLTVSVSMMKEPGIRNVRRLALELDFPEIPRVHVVDVLPRTSYITFGKVGARGTCNASVDFGGRTTMPVGAVSVPFGGAHAEAAVEAGAGVSFLANVGFEVSTPEVEAIGIAGSFAQWIFTRQGGRSLVGDHLVCATLLVPRSVKELRFRARTTATVTSFGLIESPWRSEWMEMMAELR